MNHLDELRSKYKVLLEVTVPTDLREKIHERIDQEATKVPSHRTKRRKPALWIGYLAAVVAVAVVAGGVVSNTEKHQVKPNGVVKNTVTATSDAGNGTQTAGPSWGIPSSIAWNGYYYATKGSVDKVGANLGVTAFPGPAKVYRIPGQSPDHEVALFTGAPYAKYVLAVRVPIVKIPSSWMAINTPVNEPEITVGSKVKLAGDVFYRKLYGTTVTVSLKRQGAKYPKFLSTQTFEVSRRGQINGTFTIPNRISVPNHTPFLLVFQGKFRGQVTTEYYYPLMFKKGDEVT